MAQLAMTPLVALSMEAPCPIPEQGQDPRIFVFGDECIRWENGTVCIETLECETLALKTAEYQALGVFVT